MFKRNIRNKLILLLLLATIVPSSIYIIVSYVMTSSSLESRSIQENKSLLSLGSMHLGSYLNTLDKISLSVYNSPNLERILTYGLTDYLSENTITQNLNSLYGHHDDIYQIHLHIKEGNRSYLRANGLVSRTSGLAFAPNALFNSRHQSAIEPTHPSHNYGMAAAPYEHTPPLVFTIHRPLYQLPRMKLTGYLSIDIRLDTLQRILSKLYVEDAENLYLFDKSGYILYSSEYDRIGQRMDAGLLSATNKLGGAVGSFESGEGGTATINIYDTINDDGAEWTLLKQIPGAHLYKDIRRSTAMNIYIGLLFLVIIVLITLFVSFRFTTPIKRLIAYINSINTGNLQTAIQLPSRGEDEIGLLMQRFKQMMNTINNLILKEYKLELANRTNQFKALSAQINPHFMNNALQTIGTLALEQNSPNIYHLISSLGRMMQYSMTTEESIVLLSREIEHVRSYLEMQKHRFDEHLQVAYKLDEEALVAQVPKLIVQTLVENCFKHSFDQWDQICQIEIRCESVHGNVLISVENNGVGIADSKLREIVERLQTVPGQAPGMQESIGLVNVLSRLQLYCGPDSRLDIANTAPSGVRVTLWIPASSQADGGEQDESINR